MRKEDFEFGEGDQPLITVRVTKRNPVTGKKEPYPLAGTTAEMLIRPATTTPDNDPSVIRYATGGNGITYDEVNGLILIQTNAAAGTVGRKVHVIRLIVNGRPRTLLYGSWRILDI